MNEIIKYGGSRRSQKIIKRTVWARIEPLGSFKSRSCNRRVSEYWGGRAQIPYKIMKGQVYCKIHNNWIFMSDSFDFEYHDDWLWLRVPRRYFGLSCQSGDLHNNFVLLPDKIILDDKFFEGLGLQQGDGTHSPGGCHITFTNGLYELIEHQLGWFNRLGIHLSSIRIYPEIPAGKLEDFARIKRRLKVVGVSNYQVRNGKFSKENNAINVLIQIVVHNRLFKFIYLYMLSDLRKVMLENKQHTADYLKGIIAAEGCIRLDSKSFIVGSVKISASSTERRAFYKLCLAKLGISASKDERTKGSEAVVITNYKNFKLIHGLGLLSLHPIKQEKFINALKRYKNRG